MHQSLILNIVEHGDGVNVYVWRQDVEGRYRKRRQVRVVFVPEASITWPPQRVLEALRDALGSSPRN